MELKKIKNDIYDVSSWLDTELGEEGSINREKHIEKAWEEYNAHILLEARKNAQLTQSQLAERLGVNKSYISRVERGVVILSISFFYKMIAAMGLQIDLHTKSI